MESQPQNPEFRINSENFHPWSIQFFIQWLRNNSGIINEIAENFSSANIT